MIERARRVLPGMVMTLLLSAPALVATSHEASARESAGTTAKNRPVARPRATAVASSKPVAHSPTPHTAAAHHAAPARPAAAHATNAPAGVAPAGAARATVARGNHGVVRPHGIVPTFSQENGGRMIHRASFSSGRSGTGQTGTGEVRGALIDDGTLWREQGSNATWQQTGVASWYGGKHWQGHRTSSGDRYDENALTAAHATLPLGTKVRVVRHDGAKSVIVTINDRPGTRTRIIDLSREAAKALGILDTGVAMVTLQPM